MTDSAWMYEQMSYPLLKMELRRLRGELEKLTARAEGGYQGTRQAAPQKTGKAVYAILAMEG